LPTLQAQSVASGFRPVSSMVTSGTGVGVGAGVGLVGGAGVGV
jgi:hypothetical protein